MPDKTAVCYCHLSCHSCSYLALVTYTLVVAASWRRNMHADCKQQRLGGHGDYEQGQGVMVG